MNPLTNVRNIQKLNQKELDLGLIGKKSWHDQYKDSAWIFIGGLPYDLTEGDIICVFSQYGELVNINIVRDKQTGKTKGYGFICYEDQRSTVLAVDNLNGIRLLGRTIRVDHVENYRQPKELGDEDDVTKQVRADGIAPTAKMSDEEEEVVEVLPLKKKKDKKAKKKKEKKKKKEVAESDSDSDRDDGSPVAAHKGKSVEIRCNQQSENIRDHRGYNDNKNNVGRGEQDSGRDRQYHDKVADRRREESPVRGERHKERSPVRGDLHRDGSSNRSDRNRDRSPVRGDLQRDRSPSRSDRNRDRSPVRGYHYRNRSPVRGDRHRDRSPVGGDRYRNRPPVMGDRYRDGSPVRNSDSRSANYNDRNWHSESRGRNRDDNYRGGGREYSDRKRDGYRDDKSNYRRDR